MHQMLSPFEVMEKVEQWILEHRQDHKRSTLKRLVPSVGKFYTRLKLVDALKVSGARALEKESRRHVSVLDEVASERGPIGSVGQI